LERNLVDVVLAQRYTVEAFEHLADLPENRDRLLELIHGEIVEKEPPEEHRNTLP
jgi:hypothetical protein